MQMTLAQMFTSQPVSKWLPERELMFVFEDMITKMVKVGVLNQDLHLDNIMIDEDPFVMRIVDW